VSSGLLTYKTDLKSLKFGKDRLGGGSSNQPYIKSKIPSNEDTIPGNLGDRDFLLRGGIGAPLDALDDVVRLGKYFTDLKSVSGPLFIAKQNILSRIAPATQASGNQSSNNKWKKAALNEGIYTPLSTLAQAGVGFLGGHVDKQGINLIRGIRTYSDVAFSVIGSPSGKGNRLVDLANTNRGVFAGPNIFSYSGGPNSAVGIGKTHIQFAKDNQGGTLRVLGNESYTESFITSQTGLGGSDTSREGIINEFRAPWGASKKFVNIAGGKIENFGNLNNPRQFLFHGGIDLDYIDSSDNITWDNVIKNTTINPYTKSTIAGSSKPEYVGNNSMPLPNIPIGASLRFADITKQGKSVKIPSSFGGDKVLSSAIVVNTNGIANVSGVAGSIEENKNIVEITSNGGLTWEIPNISTNTFDPIVPISKLANPTDLFVIPGLFLGNNIVNKYRNQTGELINSNLTSDDGISWRENLTNPYATGVKGTLAKKEYVPRNFNTANPTELFIYPTGDDATSMYMFTTGEVVNSNLTSDDGISWRENLTNPYATGTKGTLATKTYVPRNFKTSNPIDLFTSPTGSTDYYTLLNLPSSSFLDSYSKSNGISWDIKNLNNVYNPGTLTSNTLIPTPSLTQEQLTEISLETQENKLNPGSKIVNFQNKITSSSPSYTDLDQVIDNNTGFNRNSYRSPGLKSSEGKVIDRVNAQYIYRSTSPTTSNSEDGSFMVDDLIPFRIGALDVNSTPQNSELEKDYIHFRAYIDSFSDNYTGEWNSTKYMGRGEKFYNYTGFERSISLAFTVAAQSKPELVRQYQKLNFLVSNLAPTYTTEGYMSGPLVELTLGDWCFNLKGFISSITLDIPEESPWEIDGIGKRLPHICKVSGFNFTPIEDFRPEKQKLDYIITDDNNEDIGTSDFPQSILSQNYINPMSPFTMNPIRD
jgi:hypothetical protein